MNNCLKPYKKYKDSGVEWLGEIPAHWEVKKLKFISKIVLGKMLCSNDLGGYHYKHYLKSKNIGWINVIAANIDKMWFSNYELNLYKVEEGDLLLSEGGEVGKTCIWRSEIEECYIQNSVHKVTIEKNNYNKFYLHYFFSIGHTGVFKAIVNQVSIAHLTREKLKEVECVVPTTSEQKKIAKYLNHKTKQANTFIEKQTRLIELLKEQKKAIINKAVTKGLTPDAPMKDSGVEWLGEIPAHWEVRKLKYVVYLKSGDSITSENIKEYDNFPVYGGNGLRGYTTSYTHEGNYILIGRQGALCGNINYAKDKFFASEHAVVCNLLVKFEFVWFGELLRTMNLNQYSQSAAQPGLSIDTIKNLFIPIPEIKEQHQIVSHIQTKTTKIDQSIQKAEKEITLVKEYLQSLIYHVVTGQLQIYN